MKKKKKMSSTQIKVMCLSDTHGTHSKRVYEFTGIDIFIHAGDFTEDYNPSSVDDFFNWLISIPVPIKILVAGNHDICLDPFKSNVTKYLDLFKNNSIIYLNNNDTNVVVRDRSLKIWGSPDSYRKDYTEYEKQRGYWAFGYSDDKNVHNIPKDVDIIVTHEPPYDILDGKGANFGSKKLLMQCSRSSKCKLHIFGHIHEGRGQIEKNLTMFVNASSPNIDDSPIVVEI